jgi:hypothetical protein
MPPNNKIDKLDKLDAGHWINILTPETYSIYSSLPYLCETL